MKSLTLQCDLEWQHVRRFKENQAFWETSATGLPCVDGTTLPWADVFKAKDGCELTRMRGFQAHSCKCPSHNRQFKLVDEDTGEPLEGVSYSMTSGSGALVEGKTDRDGLTDKIHASSSEKLSVKIYRERSGS